MLQLHLAPSLPQSIHPGEVKRIREWIEEAKAQGAVVATGGSFTERTVTPTVMTNVTADMKIICQETFAPIVSIVSYETLDDAIRLVNESELGLNAGIYTNVLPDALRAADFIAYTVNKATYMPKNT